MDNSSSQSSVEGPLPEKHWIGEDLDWEASSVPVALYVELPFWVMVPDCLQEVEVRGHRFNVEIRDGFVELYARLVRGSRSTCIYIGPPDSAQLNPELRKLIEEGNVPVMNRKCKTVLRIHSACNKDVLEAAGGQDKRARSGHLYLRSFCEAHLEVINHIVQHYRLSTYDYFAYEVSPWDVPVWLVDPGTGSVRIILLDYAAWDEKPVLHIGSSSRERYKLIEAAELQSAMGAEPSAGEFELLDSLNLMERGDYSGAIRRITTAIEAQLQSALRQELLKRHPVAQVEKKLKASENDFPGRLRQYEKLSGRKLSAGLREELDTTRTLRHSIVHSALRIPFHERAKTQRAVDTGCWIFNWLENQPARMGVRERRIAKRSLGRHLSLFSAEITHMGVIVHKPAW